MSGLRTWRLLDQRTRRSMRDCPSCEVGDQEPRHDARVSVCDYHDGYDDALAVHCRCCGPVAHPAGSVAP